MSSRKKKINDSKKAYRADKVILEQIQLEIKEMLVNLHSSGEICSHIQAKYNKSDSVARGYVSKALKEYREQRMSNIEDIRMMNQKHLLDQYRKLLAEYNASKSPKTLTLAIQYYDRYLKLFPNGLEPQVEEQEQTINISFNKIEK